MAYVAANYKNNPAAPVGSYVCAPTSRTLPSKQVPDKDKTKGTDLCGQCVSYVKRVCPGLPATTLWKKGAAVKGNKDIVVGTVIATFNAHDKYEGHAAIFVRQNELTGIEVFDQYVTPPNPRPVGSRTLRWGGHGRSNDGNQFYVVE